jgi:hypothetical protein
MNASVPLWKDEQKVDEMMTKTRRRQRKQDNDWGDEKMAVETRRQLMRRDDGRGDETTTEETR